MTSLVEPDARLARTDNPAPSRLGEQFVGRRYLQLVLVLGSLSAIGPLTIDTYLPALPQLSAEMGATDAQAQLTITGLLVGLGLGQLIIGPLSDAVGRRRPLLVGLAAHGLMSLLCAVAPSITLLAVTRTLQGVAGAAVAVVAMAVVRDLFTGVRAAQLLSRLILVLGIAPILAPSVGSFVLTITSWRGIFVGLALAAVGLWLLALLALPETLPVERRQTGLRTRFAPGLQSAVPRPAVREMVLVAGLMFATLFAYIAGAPFILQGLFGLTAQQFGVAFSANAVGMIAMTQLNPVLVRRYGPIQVVSVAVVIALVSALVLLATALTGFGGLAGFMVPLAFMLARGRACHAEHSGDRAQPARRCRRHGRRSARRRAVRPWRLGRPAGRRSRQRHRGADGGDPRGDGRSGDGAVLVRAPVAECRLGRLRFFADRGEYGSDRSGAAGKQIGEGATDVGRVQTKVGELVGRDPAQLVAIVRPVRLRLRPGQLGAATDGGHQEVPGRAVVVPARPEQAVDLGDERRLLMQLPQRGLGGGLALLDGAAG